MAKHRTQSVTFKHQVVQKCLADETQSYGDCVMGPVSMSKNGAR